MVDDRHRYKSEGCWLFSPGRAQQAKDCRMQVLYMHGMEWRDLGGVWANRSRVGQALNAARFVVHVHFCRTGRVTSTDTFTAFLQLLCESRCHARNHLAQGFLGKYR